MIRFGMGLMEIVEQLTRGFMKATGKQPGNLEKLKIQQEAIQRFKEMNKVVDMEGRAMDTTQPIIGGTQRGADLKSGIMKATGAKPKEVLSEEQIRQKLLKNNEEGLASMKSKLDDPEDFATGGRAGLKDGNPPVITIDDKIDEMISFYKDYLKKGGKMDFKTFSKQYIPENFATGGRAGFKVGSKGKAVEGLIKLIQNKFGKGAVTTADKAPIPPKTLERDMFKAADKRLSDKREMTEDEIYDFAEEIGGELDAYNFDGTVGSAKRVLKEHKEYMDDMYQQYRMGKLDPEPGDKSEARKIFLERKLEEMEMSGDKKLMTVDEIEELSNFDLQAEMDVAKSLAPKMVERLELKQKYPGITDDLLDKILIDDNMQRKAEVLATIDEAFKMMEKGKSSDEILDTMKNVTRTKQADGGIMRANFVGGGMGRRGFLKMLAGLGGGIAAAKTGLLKFAGKEPAKQVAKEVVKSAGSGTPPPYFFKLAEKIKFMGDDTLPSQDKAIAKKYKDYFLEEDFAGNIEIKKTNYGMFGDEIAPTEEVYMSYRVDDVPVKGKKGSTKVEEYEEYTARPDEDGKMKDVEDGVPEDVIDDAGDPDSMTLKKASGGIARLGYQMGGDVAYDATNKDIYGSSAATFTPDTVMDQFGNQVQSEMGNDFNKPLIPQVTEQAAMVPKSVPPDIDPMGDNIDPYKNTALSGLSQDGQKFKSAQSAFDALVEQTKKYREQSPYTRDVIGSELYQGEEGFKNFTNYFNKINDPGYSAPTLPISGGLGGIGGIDMPVAGGNKNAGGILPVMPQLPGFRDDTPTKIPGGPPPTQPNMSDEDIMKGFAEYKKQNPDIMNRPGTMAIVNLTLPGGTPMSFRSGAGAAALRQYLQSIGMEAGPGQGMGEPFKKAVQPGGTLAALASGGIARMLGE